MAVDISRRTARRAPYSRASHGRLTISPWRPLHLTAIALPLDNGILLDTLPDDLMRYGFTVVVVIDK